METKNSEFSLIKEFESDEQKELYLQNSMPSCAIAHSNKGLKCFQCENNDQRTIYMYCNSKLCFNAENEFCKAEYRLYSCASNKSQI
jgi:hypothetical protein